MTGRLANPNYRLVATEAGTFTIARRSVVVVADPLTVSSAIPNRCRPTGWADAGWPTATA